MTDDHDATMMDIAAHGQPLGDPPDNSSVKIASWVEKVTGGNVGGVPVLEVVLGDNFVTARLKLAFSDGEDGEPVITIEKEVLDVMNGM